MELGIKGHPTRGYEVIKILEMMGGKNCYNTVGNYDNNFYHIDDYNNISYSYIGPDEIKGYEIFSFDEFWKAFPYKVGDKVNVWVNHEHFAGPRAELEEAEIKSMRWNCGRCEVAYRMKDQTGEFYKSDIKGKVDDGSNKQSECEQCGRVFSSVKCFDVDCPNNTPNYVAEFKDDKVNCDLDEEENLFHTTNEYEEIVENSFQGGYEKCKSDIKLNGYDLPDGYHFTDENGNVIDATKILIKKNSPTYPKTYDECRELLHLQDSMIESRCGYEYTLISYFQQLLMCRDAYWKIAGEQMGLGKPWKPDNDTEIYNIYRIKNNTIRLSGACWGGNCNILEFPIVEMRDAFYNNFRDLIEQCKELL